MILDSAPARSALMTAYNRDKYIAETIKRVLASSFTNFELIIVDDGSAGRAVEIARDGKTTSAHPRRACP